MNTTKKRSFTAAVFVPVLVICLLATLLLPGMARGELLVKTIKSEYKEEDNQLKSPASYEELYETIKNHMPKEDTIYYGAGLGSGMYVEDAVVEEAAEAETKAVSAATGSASSASPDYSDTNIRTAGVLEGDIVKTDGRYIYSVFPESGMFSIVDTKDGMKEVYSDMLLKEYDQCREFFVVDDKLYFTGYREEYRYDTDASGGNWEGTCFLLTYDISDRSKPKLTDTYTQCGQYDSARMTDGMFYLFTNYYDYLLENESYIPTFNGEKIACEDIYYGKYFDFANYYCVGAVDLKKPGECVSAKAVLTNSGQFYVSQKTIYVISDDWIDEEGHNWSQTDIVSLDYSDQTLKGKAIGSVHGYLNDSFSVDEYDGYLRLVTTINEYTYHVPTFWEKWLGKSSYYESSSVMNNSLFILDENLKMISSLENIQKDEMIQSARFMDDVVYFVTFRNTDPLFAADLSDPYKPKMLSGIKLTGFSNYLHPWTGDLLLGIGYEADMNGMINGAKLSMFDVSDNKDIKEVDRYVIKDTKNVNMIGSDCSYKAVLADPEKNLIGFAVSDYRYDPGKEFEGTTGTYYVYSYDKEKGFQEVLKADLFEDNYWYSIPEVKSMPKEGDDVVSMIPENERYLYLAIDGIRGLYIDDAIYVVHPGVAIYRYDMNKGEPEETLVLYHEAKKSR